MIVLTYELLTLERLLVSRPEGDANSAISYLYIPGSVIRGALANRHLPQADYDLAGDDAARRLFFSTSTRYLNAYPLTPGGARTLPAPLAWRKEKDARLEPGALLYDISADAPEPPADAPHRQHKGLGQSFCVLYGPQVVFDKVERRVNVHTQRERVKGRATKEAGAVFRYQAIPAGARLGGLILVEHEADAQTLRQYLDDADLWLGRSRSGGYGHVRVTLHEKPADGWWPETPLPGDLNPGDTLVITLLSDAVLRRPDGAYVHDLDPALLPPALAASLEPARAFKQRTLVGNFNRKWGLPGIQTYALEAGSVFTYKVTRTIPATDLCAVQEQGLGEQRLEGLGRVAFNWHRQPTLTVIAAPSAPPAVTPVSLTLPSRALAGQMVHRLLARNLDQRIDDYAYSLELRNKWPSNAQLSRLRAIVLNANAASPDVTRVLTFLLDANLKPRARDQYRTARVQAPGATETTRLLHWLAALLIDACTETELADFLEQHPDARIDATPLRDWISRRQAKPSALRAYLSAAALPAIGEVTATLTPEVEKTYTLRLIAGVLHRATKGAQL